MNVKELSGSVERDRDCRLPQAVVTPAVKIFTYGWKRHMETAASDAIC